ncbi:MAG: N-acetyl-gamma-glutamyl-phosphate reductase, partial [Muribaculaceae bacterium]|nr:N-acetyl-gamma-glutamyl-phosphate reductase [Muribaculaceae bacterium]
ADGALAELSTRRDPVAPVENRPDAELAAAEIAQAMRSVQPSFSGATPVSLSRDGSAARGIRVTATLDCNQPLSELNRVFEEAYCDHGFTFLIDRRPELSDAANTNKCLIHIRRDDSGMVEITSVIDNLLKGAAGNAVHCMNLLFGLSEKTGLALKGSAF